MKPDKRADNIVGPHSHAMLMERRRSRTAPIEADVPGVVMSARETNTKTKQQQQNQPHQPEETESDDTPQSQQQVQLFRLESNIRISSIAAELPAVKATLATGPSLPPFGVFLGPVGYIGAHIGIFMLYAVCAGYFVAAGCIYRALLTTQLASMLDHYALTLNIGYFRAISGVLIFIGSVFAYAIISGLASFALQRWIDSTQSRHKPSTGRRRSSVTSSILDVAVAVNSVRSRLSTSFTLTTSHTRLNKTLRLVNAMLTAPSRLFDVKSEHFDTVLLAREVTETILQTYQAYQMSILLPRQQFNRFYVTVLVLNCWSAPILHRICGRNAALARVLCLLCDILLDLITVIGVPVWLMLDYLAVYDSSRTDFSDVLWYTDTWFVHFMNDAPLILLSSWFQLFSLLVFALGILITISDITKLIKRKPERTAMSVAIGTPALRRPTGSQLHHQNLIIRWAHRGLVLLGFFILSVQIYAESKPSVSSCIVPVRPWFSSRSACALIEIDCIQRTELSANQTDFESIFVQLEPTALKHIVIQHCPHVEITARFLSFSKLIGFKTYNATLVRWEEDAVISQTHHPEFRFLYFVRTDFVNASLPRGILPSEVPQLFSDFEICVSNLDRLPDNLHEYWPQQLALLIEFAQLTEFPVVLTKMHPFILSLANNHITSLPHEAIIMPVAFLIAFTGNPITTIPDLGIESAAVTTMQLFFDATLVAGPLPDWIDDAFVQHTTLYVGGSRFCEQVVLNTSSPDRPGLLASRPWLLDGRVDCTVFEDPSFYPLRVDDRPSNPDAVGVKRPV